METNDLKRALAEHAAEQKASQTKGALIGLAVIVAAAFVLVCIRIATN